MDSAERSRFDVSFPSVKISIIVTALSIAMNWAFPIQGKLLFIAYHLALLCVASGGLWYFVWRELRGPIRGRTVSFGIHVLSTALVPLLSYFFAERVIV